MHLYHLTFHMVFNDLLQQEQMRSLFWPLESILSQCKKILWHFLLLLGYLFQVHPLNIKHLHQIRHKLGELFKHQQMFLDVLVYFMNFQLEFINQFRLHEKFNLLFLMVVQYNDLKQLNFLDQQCSLLHMH